MRSGAVGEKISLDFSGEYLYNKIRYKSTI